MKITNKKNNNEVVLVPKTEGKLPIEFLKKTNKDKEALPEAKETPVATPVAETPEVKAEEVATPEDTTEETVVVDSAEDSAQVIEALAEHYALKVYSEAPSDLVTSEEADELLKEEKPSVVVEVKAAQDKEPEPKPEPESKPAEAPKTYTAEEVAAMLTAMGVKVVDEKKPAEKAKTKLPTKKTEEKKPVVEKPKVELKPETTPKVVPQVKLFPATLDVPNVGRMNLATGKYTTCKQITEAIDKGYIVLFANYWNKRQLKQFNYAEVFQLTQAKCPKEFPNDLDLAQVTYVCEIMVGKLYATSIMTDAMYSFFDDDLDEDEGVRVSNGMEFQIYDLLIPEAPAQEEAPKA